jgi:hypothetical protein
VWVWGFWFGFALRCVALLCGVFVRLHLALFSAGGPFLPSLYVNLYDEGWGAAQHQPDSQNSRILGSLTQWNIHISLHGHYGPKPLLNIALVGAGHCTMIYNAMACAAHLQDRTGRCTLVHRSVS